MADNEPSEFGGHRGMVQPLPHERTNVEQLRLERKTNPADPADTVDEASKREGNVQ